MEVEDVVVVGLKVRIGWDWIGYVAVRVEMEERARTSNQQRSLLRLI